MSRALQIKLLRVIQEREIMPVGGNRIIQIDVRLICATNEGLEEKVENGEFRADLYYRLCTLPLRLPPLRERQEDILPLVDRFRRELGGTFRLSPTCQEALMAHGWKGNIRELRNYVEYLVYQDKAVVEPEDLPTTFFKAARHISAEVEPESSAGKEELKRISGNAGPAYQFVLKEIGARQTAGAGVGREALLEAARQSGVSMSQYQLRGILSNLESCGYLTISRGRGGCRLTEKGMELL